jgi:hypothetical protein
MPSEVARWAHLAAASGFGEARHGEGDRGLGALGHGGTRQLADDLVQHLLLLCLGPQPQAAPYSAQACPISSMHGSQEGGWGDL